MGRTITILFAVMSVSACSSQGAAWVTEQIFVNVAAHQAAERRYDEQELFPSPNQRLACQMNAYCRTPLTKGEFISQEMDRIRARWGEDNEDGQDERSASFVPFDMYRQDYWRSQRVLLEEYNEQRSVLILDLEPQTQWAYWKSENRQD